jgi:TPR repeat protein
MTSRVETIAKYAEVAVRYRDAGNYRRAYYWWRRSAADGDGDAWSDVAYCLEHGIGVRQDLQAALDAYSHAIRSPSVTVWGWEEAHYRRGVILLRRGGRAREQALKHLKEAAADGDYPEAAAVLSCFGAAEQLEWCNCRRGRGRHVRGQARCILHPARNRHRG